MDRISKQGLFCQGGVYQVLQNGIHAIIFKISYRQTLILGEQAKNEKRQLTTCLDLYQLLFS